jgi:hypothetical protein
MKRLKVDVTTAADGSATFYAPSTSGEIHSIHYLKDATVPFADGVDFTITAELTGEGIWTEANVNAGTVRYPRAGVHSNVGVASFYAAGGTAVQDKIGLANDRVKIVIAQGGNAKKGQFIVLLD